MSSCWEYKGIKIPNLSDKHLSKHFRRAVKKQASLSNPLCWNLPEDVDADCCGVFCPECIFHGNNTAVGMEYLLYKKYITKAMALDFMLK